MTNATFCTIKLQNKSYKIKCPDEEMDNLHLAAQKLNGILLEKKNKFKRLDEYQTLIMAALDLSHELITCQREQTQQRQEFTEFFKSLESQRKVPEASM
jgi:cell division protein ZapA